VPLASVGLFAARDSATILASFTLPGRLAPRLVTDLGMSPGGAEVTAQLLSPLAMQFVSAPWHLLGMDLYNNPSSTQAQRIAFIKREYTKSALARCARIGSAFGIAGVGNKKIRKSLQDNFVNV
jgi:hypothetical protein